MLTLQITKNIYKNRIWYDCQWDNSSRETTLMTQKLINIIVNCTAFNNTQSPFNIVSNNSSRNDKCETVQFVMLRCHECFIQKYLMM